MADPSIRERITAYYGDKVRTYGATARGVDWNSPESQRTRFVELLRIMPPGPKECSVLDYGCGYGALVEVLAELGRPFRYVGFDLSTEMIDRAVRLQADARCEFTTRREGLPVADVVVASGVLNVKLEASKDEWEGYLLETLDELDRLSTEGFAFNALTSYSDPEHMRDDLYYADPTWLFDHCKRTYSTRVALLHDYGLYEFTLLVRKSTK